MSRLHSRSNEGAIGWFGHDFWIHHITFVIRPKLPKVPNAHSYMGAIGLFGFDFKMCRSHSRSNVGAIGPFYLVLIKAVLYQFLSIILYISLFSLKMNHCLDYEANK
jgi:hypothetical protein